MAIIDNESPILSESSDKYWRDELQNSRILLFEIDKAIDAFNKNSNIQSYTIDTGQDKQTVSRSNIGELFSQRSKLISQIAVLEARLNVGGSRATQICPGF